ncbi:hypothetical protein [Parazoarcus communis]|uniref:hypothetical protein n=1 Tax=Parazoarcus communis TaxID=41977 RepID=UPI00131F3C54|nr:hypothetical protein [Parazoarcus communis]
MKSVLFLSAVSAAILTGCATKGVSTADHTNPQTPKFVAEKFVNNSQTNVWDKLVKNMASSFFAINNIDKESRIINLSFSSDKPQDYIDCGRTRRTYFDGKTTETYEYGTADNIVTYKVASNTQPHPSVSQSFLLIRTAKLEGRANVYVAPEDTGTRLTVNTKSVVHIKINGALVNLHAMGHEVGRQTLPTQNIELSAVTKGATENMVTNGQKVETIICHSTGALEKAILDLAN